MPHCPECKKEIQIPKFKRIDQTQSNELYTPIAVAYCPHCEYIIGVASQELCQAE